MSMATQRFSPLVSPRFLALFLAVFAVAAHPPGPGEAHDHAHEDAAAHHTHDHNADAPQARDHDHAAGAIRLSNAWVRQAPPSADVAAGYLMVWNRGDAADRLVGVSSPAAERVELHETVREGDRVRMQPLDHVAVAAGDAALFEPGGKHLMFKGLQAPFEPGRMVTLVLHFERAGAVTVDVPVKPIGHQPQHGPATVEHHH
ncbi:hypothetical protein CCR85_00505 [Rhodothalassium salexigens]|uniref:copper chaperone PCu(A)C n=1 Tax=Rhodothalassium salexigens TaxID=1086 RepID=UPI001913031A|nr:copper chaperone PCu(A)C [Rhodothalassium salexigens]MBK5909974.1 hypothetical protein [Rhodothalassium salexigens]MBK5921618.1 hypothetical protein [Rhodothalassium salexigens]